MSEKSFKCCYEVMIDCKWFTFEIVYDFLMRKS